VDSYVVVDSPEAPPQLLLRLPALAPSLHQYHSTKHPVPVNLLLREGITQAADLRVAAAVPVVYSLLPSCSPASPPACFL